MNENQEKIDAWYANFIQQAAQPPISFRANLPEDLGRLYRMLDQPRADGAEMDNPVAAGQELADRRNELYQLAAEGKLYIFPLAQNEAESCCQIRVEPADKLLHNLKTEGETEPKNLPVPQKPELLSFFKYKLYQWFGFFKNDVQKHIEENRKYSEEVNAYNRYIDCHKNGVQTLNSNGRTMYEVRVRSMRENQEYARSVAPNVVEDMTKKLNQTENLLPWQKDAYEAKIRVFNAAHNGMPLSKEEYVDLLSKMIVGHMGDYPPDMDGALNVKVTRMQELLHKSPEEATKLMEIVRNSQEVQTAAQKGMSSVVAHSFNAYSLEVSAKNIIRELTGGNEENQKQAAYLKQMISEKEAAAENQPQQNEPEAKPGQLGAM